MIPFNALIISCLTNYPNDNWIKINIIHYLKPLYKKNKGVPLYRTQTKISNSQKIYFQSF